MKKVAAEKYRDIDFSRAKRGPVVKPEPGKTKISIRLDNTVLEYFRDLVDKAGGGNYQTLINDALLEHVHRRSTLDVVRQVVREELAPYGVRRGLTSRSGGAGARAARTPAADRGRDGRFDRVFPRPHSIPASPLPGGANRSFWPGSRPYPSSPGKNPSRPAGAYQRQDRAFLPHQGRGAFLGQLVVLG
ncbi:MAG: BrnA antitoxin family protein [Deltaproteobacteria bacterium]|nr:BrnA antitoxin family protein [Deltaproteobacteria bacterium]